MANLKQLAKLEEGSSVWNEWRSAQPSDLVPDLTTASLIKARLHYAKLDGVDFAGASLIQTRFIGATLNRTNLYGANLTNAVLIYASLHGANLTDANLSGAGLVRANLSAANLTGANLSGADLTNANFAGADLTGADLTGAKFRETILTNTNLTNVIGLEMSTHTGPSYVDHRTIECSERLPINFLRGCGLPDSLIEYLPSLLNQPISFYSCFISYSHADIVFARRLHDQLQGRGIRCWLDEHQLLPGDDIYERIDHGIKLWDKVLLCASKDSLTSWWVDNEIDTAFRKEQQLTKQRRGKVWALIPLNIDDYLFSGKWERGMAGQVKSRVAADFIGWETDNEKFEKGFELVVKALKADDSGRESTPCPKL